MMDFETQEMVKVEMDANENTVLMVAIVFYLEYLLTQPLTSERQDEVTALESLVMKMMPQVVKFAMKERNSQN